MALAKWDPEYSVNIEEIDAQHRKLLALINQLDSAMLAHKTHETLGMIIQVFIAYMREHFAYEERLMRDTGYAEYPVHKGKHEELTKQVLDLQKQLQTSERIPEQMMELLEKWLVLHIKDTNASAGHLNSKGIK